LVRPPSRWRGSFIAGRGAVRKRAPWCRGGRPRPGRWVPVGGSSFWPGCGAENRTRTRPVARRKAPSKYLFWRDDSEWKFFYEEQRLGFALGSSWVGAARGRMVFLHNVKQRSRNRPHYRTVFRFCQDRRRRPWIRLRLTHGRNHNKRRSIDGSQKPDDLISHRQKETRRRKPAAQNCLLDKYTNSSILV
jgi:hypothetical protein